MDIKLDIEHVITLANSKSATVGNIFEMVAEDIDAYTKQREDYYLEEIKNQLEQGTITSSTNMADQYADKIYKDVEADIKRFVSAYVEEAIDIINDYNFKYDDSLLSTLNTMSVDGDFVKHFKKLGVIK